MDTLHEALDAWRAAERRVEEAHGQVTAQLLEQLAEARRRYHDMARIEPSGPVEATRPSSGGSAPVPAPREKA